MQFGSYIYQMIYMGPAGWTVFISIVLALLGSCVWWSLQQPSAVPAPIAAAKPSRGRAHPDIDTPAQADPSLKPRSPAAKPPASPTDGVADGAGAEAAPSDDKLRPLHQQQQCLKIRSRGRMRGPKPLGQPASFSEQEAAAKAREGAARRAFRLI